MPDKPEIAAVTRSAELGAAYHRLLDLEQQMEALLDGSTPAQHRARAAWVDAKIREESKMRDMWWRARLAVLTSLVLSILAGVATAVWQTALRLIHGQGGGSP